MLGVTFQYSRGISMRAVRISLSIVLAILFMGPAVSAHALDNQAPVAGDDTYSVVENGVLTVPAPGVLANDSDPDGDAFEITLFTAGAHVYLFGVDADGSFSFEPEADYTGPVTVGYTIRDSNGATDTAVVNITVTENQKPSAADDFYSVVENGVLNIPAPGLLGNDSDPDGDTFAATTFFGSDPNIDTLSVQPDGSFKLEPDADYDGPITFDYVITDSHGGTDTGRAYVTVTATDPSTSIVNDEYSTDENHTLTVASPGLLANDTVASGSTLGACTDATHGTATCNADGSFSFVPEPGFSGDATFVYTVDAHPPILSAAPFAAALAANQGLVTIHVASEPTEPTDPGDDPGETEDSAPLPDTGSPLTPQFVALAAMLLVAGLVTVRRLRRI